MEPVNLRAFQKKLAFSRQAFRLFLRRTEKHPPKHIDKQTPEVAKEVWEEVDCITCANCCKKMTPTFTDADVTRIAAHLEMTEAAFIKKWLRRQDKEWVNKAQPCQFLDLKTNLCGIYAVRPADCAGFPHLTKKKWEEYAHVHKQNIDYCPATFKMVEKLTAIFGVDYKGG